MVKVSEGKRVNSEIERKLQADRKRMKNIVKILLLGCGEAGKVREKMKMLDR
jgi:hypothetical protein